MTSSSKLLAELWEANNLRKYPHGRPASELGSADFGDLIELDASLAGYISRVVRGERLSPLDLQRLTLASLRLQHLVEAMSGETHSYFLALAQLAELTERAQVDSRA